MEKVEETLKRIKGIKVVFSDLSENDMLASFNTRYFIASGEVRGISEIELISENGYPYWCFNSGQTWYYKPYFNMEEELEAL